MAYQSIILFFFFFFSANAFSAACCGGGVGLPNIITGDFKAQFGLSYANKAITHTVSENGNFIARSKENREVRETVTFKGAMLIKDFFQFGLEVPYINNTHEVSDEGEQYSELGDPTIQLNYEFLPEWTYSWWKPRGFLYFGHTFSMTKSIYETESELGTDALGTGFDTFNLGAHFYKVYRQYDFSIFAKKSLRQKRKFTSSGESIEVTPGEINSYGVSFGYSNKEFRVGTTINNFNEDRKEIKRNSSSSISGTKSYTDFGLSLSYHKDLISYSLSYNDQTFWGEGRNMNLGKSYIFGVTKFIEL